MNMATFFDQKEWYSTQKKKALSDGLLQIPWKKLLRKFKIDRFKVKPLKGEPCTLYILSATSKKPPQRELWDYTLIHSNCNISCWEISNFISCTSFEHHCMPFQHPGCTALKELDLGFSLFAFNSLTFIMFSLLSVFLFTTDPYLLGACADCLVFRCIHLVWPVKFSFNRKRRRADQDLLH